MNDRPAHREELVVLSLIGLGLISICLLIVVGIFGWFESKVAQPLPNWAENVLVALATAAVLKLGDVLAALVTLATGRQVEKMGDRLALSQPAADPAPQDAAEGARTAADAAAAKASQIERQVRPDDPPGETP